MTWRRALSFAVSCPVRPPSDPWQRTNCGPSINAPWTAVVTIQRIGICYKQRHGRRCSINLRCQCLAQGTFWSILIIESLVCTRGNWQGDSERGLSLKEEWTLRLTRQFIMDWFQSETTTPWFCCPPIVVSNVEDLPLMLVDTGQIHEEWMRIWLTGFVLGFFFFDGWLVKSMILVLNWDSNNSLHIYHLLIK